jgi:hypothetical protein
LTTGVTLAPVHWHQSIAEAEQIMFTNVQVATNRRFLEFNVGDWSVLLAGFMLAGLLVWLI